MLTTRACRIGGSRYYTDLENEVHIMHEATRYYKKGEWHCQGATSQGLYGEVDEKAFTHLYNGFSPETGEPIAQNAGKTGKKGRVCAFDFTFSAPKSISLAMAFGNEETRNELWEAHIDAVKSTLDRLEDAYAYGRLGAGGREREKGGFAAKLCHHVDSRNHDPDTHTHALIANGVFLENGDFRSFDTRPFFDKAFIERYGALYRDRLEQNVQHLGYETEHHREFFEIKGFSREVIEHFSSRQKEILDYLAKHDLGAEQAKNACLKTRGKKKNIEVDKLYAIWRQAATEMDITPEYITSLRKDPGQHFSEEWEQETYNSRFLHEEQRTTSLVTKPEIHRVVSYAERELIRQSGEYTKEELTQATKDYLFALFQRKELTPFLQKGELTRNKEMYAGAEGEAYMLKRVGFTEAQVHQAVNAYITHSTLYSNLRELPNKSLTRDSVLNAELDIVESLSPDSATVFLGRPNKDIIERINSEHKKLLAISCRTEDVEQFEKAHGIRGRNMYLFEKCPDNILPGSAIIVNKAYKLELSQLELLVKKADEHEAKLYIFEPSDKQRILLTDESLRQESPTPEKEQGVSLAEDTKDMTKPQVYDDDLPSLQPDIAGQEPKAPGEREVLARQNAPPVPAASVPPEAPNAHHEQPIHQSHQHSQERPETVTLSDAKLPTHQHQRPEHIPETQKWFKPSLNKVVKHAEKSLINEKGQFTLDELKARTQKFLRSIEKGVEPFGFNAQYDTLNNTLGKKTGFLVEKELYGLNKRYDFLSKVSGKLLNQKLESKALKASKYPDVKLRDLGSYVERKLLKVFRYNESEIQAAVDKHVSKLAILNPLQETGENHYTRNSVIKAENAISRRITKNQNLVQTLDRGNLGYQHQAWKSQGKRVIALSMSGKDVEAMRKECGIKGATLFQFEKEHRLAESDPKKGKFRRPEHKAFSIMKNATGNLSKEGLKRTNWERNRWHLRLNKGVFSKETVIVVNKAWQLDHEQLDYLTNLASEHKARLVLISPASWQNSIQLKAEQSRQTIKQKQQARIQKQEQQQQQAYTQIMDR